jgi:hypothetical protein
MRRLVRFAKPSYSCIGTAVVFSLLALSSGATGRTAGTNAAISQVEQATVIVQGEGESGTGFAILNKGDYTYLLTAAHLIPQTAYQNDAEKPPDERKPATSWLTVYDPVDNSPHDASIVGAPDFLYDVVVLRVKDLAHRLRAMCLADGKPYAAPFLVSSFHEDVILSRALGGAFSGQAYTQTVSASTLPPGQQRPFLFQYGAFEEPGFSGAPIVDQDTGAVIGLVEGGPLVPDATTGQLVVSGSLRFGVSVDAILSVIRKVAADDAALAGLPVIVEGDRTKLLPNLTASSRLLRVVMFDQPTGSDSTTMNGVYGNYNGAIKRVIDEAFTYAGASPTLNRKFAVYPLGKDVASIGDDLCSISESQRAIGVIGIRRTLTSAPGIRTLESRVGLISCSGRIIDSSDLTPSLMNGGGPDTEQIEQYANNLRTALKSLAGPDGNRLKNFAGDGLPLGDTESRGFYAVRHQGSATSIGHSWAEGAAAYYSHLFSDEPVSEIETLSPQQLGILTPQALDDALNRAGGSLRVQYGAPAPASPTPLPVLRTADRCAYFWRLFMKAGFGIPSQAEIL